MAASVNSRLAWQKRVLRQLYHLLLLCFLEIGTGLRCVPKVDFHRGCSAVALLRSLGQRALQPASLGPVMLELAAASLEVQEMNFAVSRQLTELRIHSVFFLLDI
jgi:hypothetical protein